MDRLTIHVYQLSKPSIVPCTRAVTPHRCDEAERESIKELQASSTRCGRKAMGRGHHDALMRYFWLGTLCLPNAKHMISLASPEDLHALRGLGLVGTHR